MAEEAQEEKVIVLKEVKEDEAQEETKENQEAIQKPQPKNIQEKILNFIQKPIFLFFVGVLFLFIVFLVLLVRFDKNDENYGLSQESFITKSFNEKEIIKQDLKDTDIERLIHKASLLYNRGDYKDALDIFDGVSIYNQSLSLYNLGVVSMRKKNYKEALEYFQKAINTNENKCESAINAGVCSFLLNDKNAFKYYLDLAQDSLSSKVNSPAYLYFYMLINYYRNRPIQVIAASKDPNLKDYESYKNQMLAKSYFTLGDIASSAKYLEDSLKDEDLLNLALMNARIGQYSKAIDIFKEAISKNIDVNRSKEALMLTYLKDGQLFMAGTEISSMIKKKNNIGMYPVEISLKRELFDIELIQDYFSKNLLLDKESMLGILFYFTPYRIMDATQSVKLVQKGEISINYDDINNAQKYLNNSLVLSGVNRGLILGVKMALDNKIISANEIFKKIERSYRGNSVLEYNLALSYAQLGDYVNAYSHFARSYFLDKKNKLAGVFSIILSPYAGADESDNLSELTDLLRDDNSEESQFLFALLNFCKENFLALSGWLNIKKESSTKNLLLDIFVADKLGENEILIQKADKLHEIFPNDFLAKVLNIYAKNKNHSIKKLAFSFQDLIQKQNFDKDGLYYGSDITRDLYIKLSLLTGNLRKVRQILKDRMKVEVLNPKAIMQAVALIDVYLGYFEEAFVIYSDLIDKQRIRSTKMMLLASVAAIGAKHKANAIALLELVVRQNKRNFEARYALALLNMEVKNYEGAAIMLNKIDENKYISKYFDFQIVYPK